MSPYHEYILPGRIRMRPRERRRGFALLVTVTLLAFLVLLLVSLASLTRVETQVAANSSQLAQARANALFALNLAVGQLQKYAGPDQAVTARADIDAANTGNPYWTGVWSAVQTDAGGNPVSPPSHALSSGSQAPKVWLVSGNEAAGPGLSPATAAVADPADGNDNVWLVRRILGQELAPKIPDYPVDGRIKLAKTPIQVPAGQLPGFSDSSGTPPPVGAYAWWVGDEGTKAKINLEDPYRAAPAASAETAWRRHAPPRPGLEMLAATTLQGAFTATTAEFEEKRAALLTYQQLPMLSANLAGPTGVAQAGRYFHDLTTVGEGVLADTLRGGLRRDLTRGLAAAPAVGSTAGTEIGDGVAVFTLPTPGPYGRTTRSPTSAVWTPSTLSNSGTKNGEPLAPTWDEIRAWLAARAPAAGAMDPVNAPLADTTRNGVTCPTTTGHAIVPVLVMLELGYGLDVGTGVGTDAKFNVMMRPRVVLMNPYNVALSPASYCVVYQPFVVNKSDIDFNFNLGAQKASPSFLLGDLISLAGSKRMAFNITDSFGPGEVKVYSLPPSATDTLIDGTASIVELAPGLTTNRAYFATGAAAPSWYQPSDRKSISVAQAALPADHPRISLAVGKATPAAVPAPCNVARYIQTAAVIYAKPHQSRPLDDDNDAATINNNADTGRQRRTLRFTLRHAELDLLTNGNGNMTAEGEFGADLPSDTTSGARFLIDSNPRAIVSQRLAGRDDVAQYAVTALQGTNYTDIDFDTDGGATLGFWGGSADSSSGTSRIMLFDVLRQGEEVVSIGRLGQVNWGVDGKHPTYPLGNSFASVFYPHNAPDYGYALNEAIWDRFFFSTLPASLAVRPDNLPNSRLRFHDPAGAPVSLSALEGGNGYQLAATRLTIDGAFNINSTSVEAWTAFLGSVQAADYAYKTQSAAARTDSAARVFPRMQNLHDPDPTAQTGNAYEWTGYRKLDNAQLRLLAARIVDGIKARGRPARSLAEFMNRDLSQPSTDARNQMGIVQAAINAVVNSDDPAAGGAALTGLDGLNAAKIVAKTFSIADNPDAARGKIRSAGAPGFLMQSDLLNPLAPAMSARSDTFRVRAYGEARNPATGQINGRVWCEAVVQRQPELVGGEPAETLPGSLAAGSASATFGRKFTITQFRWLGSDEI